LLERLIAEHDGFCALGELHFIWERSFAQNQLCGCGERFYDCPFWAEVVRVAFAREPRAFDASRARRLKDGIDRKRALPWLLARRRPPGVRRALAAYAALLEPLYDAARTVSGARAVLDSSKDPKHGLILARMPRVQLHVVHLVRDPRAVAFSWRRRRRRPEVHWTAEDMPIEPVRATAARWLAHNALVERLASRAASFQRLRYEDLVAEPAASVERVLRVLPWERPSCTPALGASVTLAPSHTVAGNPMRFRHGRVQLRLDDEWRAAMRPRDRLAVLAAAWPLLARYGYPLRTARP
jgi:hypothetical protein